MPNPQLIIKAEAAVLKTVLPPEFLDKEMRKAQEELAADAEIIFASFALHRTGRMARNIHTIDEGDDLTVITEARNPQTGFDYVRITRFGHRTYRIVPLRPFSASIVATHKLRAKGHRAALRWVQTDGTVIYRRSSKGFHPLRDWASEAMPSLRIRAQQRVGVLAKRIEIAWNNG